MLLCRHQFGTGLPELSLIRKNPKSCELQGGGYSVGDPLRARENGMHGGFSYPSSFTTSITNFILRCFSCVQIGRLLKSSGLSCITLCRRARGKNGVWEKGLEVIISGEVCKFGSRRTHPIGNAIGKMVVMAEGGPGPWAAAPRSGESPCPIRTPAKRARNRSVPRSQTSAAISINSKTRESEVPPEP